MEGLSLGVEFRGLDETMRKLNRLGLIAAQRVKEQVAASAANVERGAKKRCPVDTGRLRASITRAFYQDGLTAEIGTNVEYAAAVEFGTAPHEIRPKRKKALYWKGAAHPVKLVRHPGTKGRPYLFPAWEEERPRFVQGIAQALRVAADEVKQA